jgi:acetate kinase
MTRALALTLNAGSSSLKFALYAAGDPPRQLAEGQVENIGGEGKLTIQPAGIAEKHISAIVATTHAVALAAVLSPETGFLPQGAHIAGVGHRVVHGGPDFAEPKILDDQTLEVLHRLSPLAPLHQPHNLAAVEAARDAFPQAIQVACFDTAFHRGHCFEEEAFALPRRYFEAGVRRYGFHGLSYTYIAGELARVAPRIASGKVIVAHLGNGASMCAINGGRSVASTMGLSALDGLAMGTRTGQIDPGAILYLLESEGLSAPQLSNLLYKQSGLLGLSGLSHDMRALEAAGTAQAEQAISYFVHRIRRETGALAAVLGGLDALVFTGGIGENSPRIRAEACMGMEFLGIAINAEKNARNAEDIGAGQTRVLRIATDEESVIARAVFAALA